MFVRKYRRQSRSNNNNRLQLASIFAGSPYECIARMLTCSYVNESSYKLVQFWTNPLRTLCFLFISHSCKYHVKVILFNNSRLSKDLKSFKHNLNVVRSKRVSNSSWRSGVGVTKVPFVNFSARKIFDLAKVPLRFFQSPSCGDTCQI